MSDTSESMFASEYLRTVYEPDPSSEHARRPIECVSFPPCSFSLLIPLSIVFVHGINPLSTGDYAEQAWTHDNGYCWPMEQLPQDKPSVRIHIFSYNSKVSGEMGPDAIIRHNAQDLLIRLSRSRDKAIMVPTHTLIEGETA